DRKRIARFILELEDDPDCAYYAAFVRDDCDERAVGYVGNVFLLLTVASRNDRVGGSTTAPTLRSPDRSDGITRPPDSPPPSRPTVALWSGSWRPLGATVPGIS